MGYLALFFIIAGIVGLLYSLVSHLHGRKAGKKRKSPYERMNIPGREKPDRHTDRQKSMDRLYAESHGMWVCRRCETLNDGRAESCAACGAGR